MFQFSTSRNLLESKHFLSNSFSGRMTTQDRSSLEGVRRHGSANIKVRPKHSFDMRSIRLSRGKKSSNMNQLNTNRLERERYWDQKPQRSFPINIIFMFTFLYTWFPNAHWFSCFFLLLLVFVGTSGFRSPRCRYVHSGSFVGSSLGWCVTWQLWRLLAASEATRGVMEHRFIAVFGVITVSSNNLFGILQMLLLGFFGCCWKNDGKLTQRVKEITRHHFWGIGVQGKL